MPTNIRLPSAIWLFIPTSAPCASTSGPPDEPDYIVEIDATIPSDTYFSQLWAMHNTGQSGGTVDADIDAPKAKRSFGPPRGDRPGGPRKPGGFKPRPPR